MSLVRFATVCDRCHVRGSEYTSFPICEQCERDICDHCTAYKLTDWDHQHRSTVVCRDCKEVDEMRRAQCRNCKEFFPGEEIIAHMRECLAPSNLHRPKGCRAPDWALTMGVHQEERAAETCDGSGLNGSCNWGGPRC